MISELTMGELSFRDREKRPQARVLFGIQGILLKHA